MKTRRNVLIVAAGIAVITVTMPFASVVQTRVAKNTDAGALRPFQRTFCIESGIAACSEVVNSITVPVTTSNGEPVLRLVIEYVSGRCETGQSGFNTVQVLRTTANGTRVSHFFAPFPTNPGFQFIHSQATWLYADPGSVISFSAGITTSDSHCSMTVSGHLAVVE